MPVAECRKRVSMREYRCWVHRINKERKQETERVLEPDLTHYYLMQVAAEIRLLRFAKAKSSKEVKLSDFVLKPKDEPDIPTAARNSQEAWMQRFRQSGHKVKAPDFSQWQQQLMKS